jgi:hypothetical protein
MVDSVPAIIDPEYWSGEVGAELSGFGWPGPLLGPAPRPLALVTSNWPPSGTMAVGYQPVGIRPRTPPLAQQAARRAHDAATLAESPELIAFAMFARTPSIARNGGRGRGARLLDRAIDEAQPLTAMHDDATTGAEMFGLLHLMRKAAARGTPTRFVTWTRRIGSHRSASGSTRSPGASSPSSPAARGAGCGSSIRCATDSGLTSGQPPNAG